MSGGLATAPSALPPTSDQAANPYASAVAALAAGRQQQATSNLLAGQDVDPDHAAIAQSLAPVLGVPAAAIEADPKTYQQAFATSAARATMNTDSRLQEWMAASPDNAKLSHDDVPQLGFFGRMWAPIKQGFEQATINQRIGELGFSEQTGTAPADAPNLMQTLKERLAATGPSQPGIMAGMGRMVGSVAQGMANAAPEVTAGAAVGAGLGLAAGGVGAIPGAIAGASTGLVASFAGNAGIETSGQIYNSLSNATDKNGRPIPEITRQAAAGVGGLLSAALATVGGDTLSAPVKALAGSFIRDVAVEAATRPTLARAMGTFAASATRAGVTGALVNGGMAAAQTIAPDIAKAITSPDFQTVFNDPQQRDAMKQEVVNAMETGGLAFPLAELPMHGMALWADAARADAASKNVAAWSGIQSAAAASKLRQRAPEAFADLATGHAADAHVPSIFVPGERMAELYQGINVQPGGAGDPFHFVPDMPEQLSRAQLTGGDVEIPTADFTARLAGTPIEQQLRDDIRFVPDAMTNREAMEFQAQHAGSLELDVPGMTDQINAALQENTERNAIRDDAEGQLRKAGFTPDVADQYATLLAERYATRGQRLGVPALELYHSEGLQVSREAQPLGQVPYDQVDEALDALRSGNIPSDGDILGHTLGEFLASKGGVRDDGGELKGLGADEWHKGKPFQKRLVSDKGMSLDEAGELAGQNTGFGPHGYFPELQGERPEPRDVIDALHEEMLGRPRYLQPDADQQRALDRRDLAMQLDRELNERGIDPKTASNREIRAALVGPEAADTGETRFVTSSGSSYVHHADGTTTRDKAFRTAHGEAEQGPQPRSGRTLYVSAADVQKLGEFQARGVGGKAIVEMPDGRLGMKYLDGDKAGKVERRTVVNAETEPRAGLHPVEMWDGGQSVHFGNEITSIEQRTLNQAGRLADTNTPEFRRWFGDSKIVDADGHPLIVHHGSVARRVEQFREDKIGTANDTGFYGRGYYFTPSEDLAQDYRPGAAIRRGSMVSTYLKIEKPFIWDVGTPEAQADLIARAKEVMPEAEVTTTGFSRVGTDMSARWTAALKKAGYDGVVVNVAGEPHEIVAFEPTQIKSIRNKGTFDPNDPRILHQGSKPAVVLRQNRVPVAHLSGEELAPHGADIETLRKAAADYYDRELRDGPAAKTAIGDVTFARRGRKKMLAFSADADKLRALPLVRSILEKGDYEGRENIYKPRKDGIVAFHRFAADVKVGDHTARRGVLVYEDTAGNKFYDLRKVENGAASRNTIPAAADTVPGDGAPELFQAGGDARSSEPIGKREGDPLVSSRPANTAAGEDLQGDGSNFNLSLEQPGGGGDARGSITLGDGRRIIRLFKDADLSTFLHEMGHQFLDEMFRDGAREDAPADMREDLATIRKALGLGEDAMPGVEQHEQWARSFETYLMEGKAPSSALRLAFQKFSAWLTRIYRTLAGLQAPINDKLRSVMDRMVATDDAIDEARNGLAMRNPLFRSAEDAGMTAGEFAAYTGMLRKASQTAYDRTLARAMRAERASATKEFRAAIDEARPGVEAEVKARPVLRAWHYLARGSDIATGDKMMAVKMNRAAVRDLVGDGVDRLPTGLTSAAGSHPDIIASLFGYGSGEDLVRDLIQENLGRGRAEELSGKRLSLDKWVSRLVDQSVREKVMQRLGDPALDGTIEEAARAAAHNAAQRDVFAAEFRQLAKVNGAEPPFSVRDAERWVKSQMADTPIAKATRVAGYRRAEAQAGRDAERALLAKNPVEAFKAKQRQMLAHLMATEAQRLSDTFEKTTRTWRSIAKSPTRHGTAQEFMDQAHGILARLGLQVRRDAGELARGLAGKPLDRFVETKAANGYGLLVPAFVQDARFEKFYGDLTADEFEGVRDGIASIMRAGRAQEEVTLDGRRVALADLVEDAVQRIEEGPGIKQTNRLRPERARDIEGAMHTMVSRLRAVDASLLKVEQLFSELDGERGTGPFLKMFDRLKQAQHAENDRLAVIAGQWRGLKEGMPAGWAKGLRERFTIPELIDKDSGRPVNMTRDELLGMALNVGNTGPLSNMEKLTKGMGWDEAAVMSVLRQRLTAADWKFVQATWDIFEGLTPDIEDMQRRLTGVGITRVEATPVETPHGTLRGGYFPVIYDATKAPTARAGETAEGILDPQYFRAATNKGHTVSRVEYNAPLRLGLDQIPYKLGQVVHDLTHREAIMDAWKMVNHPEISGAIKKNVGIQYQKLLNPWLRDLANNRNTDDKMLGWMDSAIRRARVGASAVGIGFRLSTVLKHGMSALSNSVGEVGGKELLAASRDIYGAGGAAQRTWIMERSGELRHRMESIDRDARESLKELMGEGSIMQTVQRLGYYPVAAMDMGSAMPTWLAAYRKGMAGGLDDEAAVAEADRAVRFAHGSSGAADLAAIQRGPEVKKALTMFYSFFNHMYNRERATVQIARRGLQKARGGDSAGARRDFVAVAGRSLYYLMVPALVETLVSGNNSGDNWFERGALGVLNQAAGGIPILRDIMSAALTGHSYELSPLVQVPTETGETVENFGRAVGLSDKPMSGRWLQHAIDTAGYATELPLGQAGAAAQYLWDIGDGVADPQDISDFLSGLMHGGPPKGQQ